MADAETDALGRRAEELIFSIRNELQSLSSREYPTSLPIEFVEYLKSILSGCERLAASNPGASTIRSLCGFFLYFAEHIEFIDSAGYPKIPWALISPMEKLILTVVPNSKVILRADWEYNYSIWRLSEVYRRMLEPRKPFFTNSVFADPSPIWHVVTLPLVDRDNILLHVMLGHEVGHKIAELFLDQEDQRALQAEINLLVGDGKWFDRAIDDNGPLFAVKLRRELYDKILEMRACGLRELISDLVGLYIFGPSFLFGLRDFSLDDVLDQVPPGPSYHPPWRYRLRLVLGEYEALGYQQELRKISLSGVTTAVRDAALRQVEVIREIARATSDQAELAKDSLVDKAYRSIELAMVRALPFTKVEVGALLYQPEALMPKIDELIATIALGVVPAEASDRLVDFRDAILAGALYKTARLPIPYVRGKAWQLDDDLRLNRLVHKALEYCDIGGAYKLWEAQQVRR